jgi:hypothetical protein
LRYECPDRRPCNLLLALPADTRLWPDHVCGLVAIKSLQTYADEVVGFQYINAEQEPPERQPLARWTECAPLPVQESQMWSFKSWGADGPGPAPDRLLALGFDFARLGLVVTYSAPGWRARLFCSVEEDFTLAEPPRDAMPSAEEWLEILERREAKLAERTDIVLGGWKLATPQLRLEPGDPNDGDTYREAGEAGAKLLDWYGRTIKGQPYRPGRPAALSRDEKRAVLAAMVRDAEQCGTRRDALTLADAAHYLDDWCERPQPQQVAGHILSLPTSVTDWAADGSTNRRRRVNRLKQWLEDIFGHQSWRRARPEL